MSVNGHSTPLSLEDPLKKETATHSSILASKIPWTERVVGCRPWSPKELDTTEQLHFHYGLYVL